MHRGESEVADLVGDGVDVVGDAPDLEGFHIGIEDAPRGLWIAVARLADGAGVDDHGAVLGEFDRDGADEREDADIEGGLGIVASAGEGAGEVGVADGADGGIHRAEGEARRHGGVEVVETVAGEGAVADGEAVDVGSVWEEAEVTHVPGGEAGAREGDADAGAVVEGVGCLVDEDGFVVVAEDDDVAGILDKVHACFWVRAVADDVAEADQSIDTGAGDIREHGLECLSVGMDVCDEPDSCHPGASPLQTE